MKLTVVILIAALLIGAAIALLPSILASRLPPPAEPATPSVAPTLVDEDVAGLAEPTPTLLPLVAATAAQDKPPVVTGAATPAPQSDVQTTGPRSVPTALATRSVEPGRGLASGGDGAGAGGAQSAGGATSGGGVTSAGGGGTASGGGVMAATPAATFGPAATVPPSAGGGASGRHIYTGVSIANVPWDLGPLAAWERTVAGKSASIVHFWVFWRHDGAYQHFDSALFESVRARGSIPMITWAPEEPGLGINQESFQLLDIINGAHDDYIRQWAAEAKAWGQPFFLRWAHEPDGDWFPWGEDANGNQRGQYAVAWQHVHDVFTQVGATNVTWVWCPNVEFPNSPRSSYASLYPGDRYVDWTCIDGYNWGADFPQNGGWSSFRQIFRYAYDTILQVAPRKPIMLGEWASSEKGGSKADWIRDAFGVQIPTYFPKIRAVVWYNQLAGPVDWRIESSPASSAAYRAAIASDVYRGAEYGTLAPSPIPPP